jgi:hypothetical protein
MQEPRPRPEGPLARGGERGALDPRSPVKRKATLVEGPPFWSDLPGLFAYPFRGDGLVRNLISAVFFAILFAILSRFPGLGPGGLILGATLAASVCGYVLSYFLSITRKTTEGEAEPPEWPDFRSFPEMAGEFASLFFLCLLPLAVPVAIAAWAGARVGGPAAFAAPLLASLPGLFYVPMSVLVYAITGSAREAFNPILVCASIGKCIGPYLLVTPFVYGILLLFFAASLASAFVPFSGILFYFLVFYLFMVLFRLLGLFYLQCQVRLGWYRE